MHEYSYIGVPKTGAVWFGQVITATRRAVMLRYRSRHEWLAISHYDGSGSRTLAPHWTAKERAVFRKWRADFMRPMNVATKRTPTARVSASARVGTSLAGDR